jgi:hypothetical protein
MRLTARAISNKLIFLTAFSLSFFILASCVSPPAPELGKKAKTKLANLKVFYASYDNVWRAAQLALKYPVAINNMDNGVLETDYIKADDGFISPSDAKVLSSGIRYKITMILAKGKVDGRDSVRVTINKAIEKKRDFFADPESLPSDGLEEMVLFYRMERELTIDEALKRAAKTSQ